MSNLRDELTLRLCEWRVRGVNVDPNVFKGDVDRALLEFGITAARICGDVTELLELARDEKRNEAAAARLGR